LSVNGDLAVGDTADSAEYKEVLQAKIKFYDLLAGKFYHTYNPLKLIRIPLGFIQAGYWLLKERPAGIVSFGGYLAVPTVIMGWLLGIKSVTHEQTVVTGWANKMLTPFVSKVAVTWPSSQKYYPSDKVELVGLPIRSEILAKSKVTSGLIYITGGKQGSAAINKVVAACLDQLTKVYSVIHQTGHHQVVSHQNYSSFDFDSHKAIEALHQADVVVSRAGAHTIYELGLLGKKCVLIPLPSSSHQEQNINAQLLAQAGLAVVLPEAQLTAASLLASIQQAKKLQPQPMNLPTDATLKMVHLIEQTLG
jgi:UDP-N-acetylglucosamine--N-acetylmuramyl-(pentapeptide) pyrophosphoryl-undecaprenol N-acetylglucosamine transferase